MKNTDPFDPPRYLRSPALQTILASSGLRKIGTGGMDLASREDIADAGDGVRLQGFISRQLHENAKGLVILLHGWEGSSRSAYILSTGRFLYRAGYDVYRLNLRDHGTSHHLNRGVFLGTLIDETIAALQDIAVNHGRGPVFIAGFSMGGNFALRVSRLCADRPIAGLNHIVCFNPPLDPYHATSRVDGVGYIRKYFVKKWKRSLAIKQRLFPDEYDFTEAMAMDTCLGITDMLLSKYTSYRTMRDYFSKYTLYEGWLERAAVPVTIITSDDDPIIRVEDFRRVKTNGLVTIDIQRYGGHCGYITGLPLRAWYEKRLLEIFSGRR